MDTLYKLFLRTTVSLLPHQLSSPQEAILQKLYAKIHKWDPQIQVKPGSPLGAVLLAFDKCEIQDAQAKMLPDDPTLVHYPVSFEGLVFAPLPGECITATLTHVLQNTVFLNLMDLFTIQVPLAPDMNELEQFKIEAEHEKKLKPDLDVELLEVDNPEEDKDEGGLLLDVNLPDQEEEGQEEEDNESDHYSILRQYFKLIDKATGEEVKPKSLLSCRIEQVKILGEKKVIFASQLSHFK